MAPNEFPQVINEYAGLWPTSQLTDPIRQSLWVACKSHCVKRAVKVLQEHHRTGSWPIKANELALRLTAASPPSDAWKIANNRGGISKENAKLDEFIDSLSDDELECARREIIGNDKGLEGLYGKIPVRESRGLKRRIQLLTRGK
jgi:hypothetical protein